MKLASKLITFCLILLCALGAVGFLSYLSQTREVEGRISRQLECQAQQTLDKIDRLLFERIADMRVLASDPVIASRDATPEMITARLKEYQRHSMAQATLTLFDAQRFWIAGTGGGDAGSRHAFTEYWPAIAEGRDLVSIVGLPEKGERALLHLAAAVRDRAGKTTGVVVSRMALDTLCEIAGETARPEGNGHRLKVELLDKDGTILSSSYDARGALREKSDDWAVVQEILPAGKNVGSARHRYGAEEEITASAREGGYRDFRGNGWILTICTPVDEAFAGVFERRNRALAAFSVIGSLVLLGTVVFSRSITRPLRELGLAAAEVGRGNLETKVDVQSQDEVGQLAQAFNGMARDLRESGKRFQDLAELLPQYVFETEETGKLVFLNRFALENLGYAPEELAAGLRAAQLFPPARLALVEEAMREMLRGKVISGRESVARKKDGTVFPVLLSASPIVHDGKVAGIRGVGVDITELKRAEERIRRAGQEWARTFDAITSPIMILDTRHRIVKANRAMADKLGLTPATAEGLVCYEAVHGLSEPPAFCPHAALLADGRPHVKEIHEARLGGDFIVSVSPLFAADGTLYGSVHHAADVTELEKSKVALEEQERFLSRILDSIQDGISILDEELRVVRTNATMKGWLADRLPLEGRRCYEAFHARAAPCESCPSLRTLESGKPESRIFPIVEDGAVKVWMEQHTFPLFDPAQSRVTAVIEHVRDITDRKSAEEQLLLRGVAIARLHGTLVRLAQNEGIYSGDLSAAFRAITAASSQALEVSRASIWFYTEGKRGIVCKDLYDGSSATHAEGAVIPAAACPRYFQALKEEFCIVADDAFNDPRTAEFSESYLKPLGITSMLDVPIIVAGEVMGVVCHEHVGPARRWSLEEQSFATAIAGFSSVAIEVAARKLAEEKIRKLNEALEVAVQERTRQLVDAQEELVRKEKLSILGQLAGSVGHELRNPLGVMSNAVYYLKTVVPDSEQTVREYLQIIKGEIDSCERIISDLLDFSRTRTAQTRPTAVADLIGRSLGRCPIPEGIQISTEIPEALPLLDVDPFQIGQVLQNLTANALQAMPNGGSLRISARRVCGSGAEDREAGRKPGEELVEIAVADTGEGIAPENMGKLFQPLFTTKAKGIGLGLVASKRLTEANGGTISVSSVAGQGTTFMLRLPVQKG